MGVVPNDRVSTEGGQLQDAMPRIRAVLALSDLAKDRKDWRTVEVATALLDEQTLGHEGDTFNGRRQESEFEKWSKHRVEALSKLGAGPEALALATRAVDQHSDNFWLNRLKGLCQIQGGDPAEGVKLLRRLYGLKAEWYIAGEIAAGLEALGKDLEALSWYCRACWRTAPDKAINYFPKMANLLEKNQRWEEALHHLLLSWAVSSQNSWEKRATNDLDSIKRFLSANGKHISDLPNLAQPPRLPIMVKRCREVWDEAMKFKPDLPTGTIHRFRLDENKGTISYQDRLIPFRGDDFLEGGRTPDFEEKVSFQIVEFDEVDGSGSQQWATEIMPL